MTTTTSSAIASVVAELAGLELITEPNQVAKLSQDYYHFSPVLVPQLQDKVGDVVVRPANEAEVLQVAKACVRIEFWELLDQCLNAPFSGEFACGFARAIAGFLLYQ
jgi:hypothetical protein